MTKLKELLSSLAARLASREQALVMATNRYHERRKEAFKAHQAKVRAQEASDRLRLAGHETLAEHETKIADRAHSRELKRSARAQFWLGRIKREQRRIHGLEVNTDKAKADLEQYKKEHGVQVEGNYVTGGTPRQRLRVAIHTAWHNCVSGVQNNYYSMTGALPDLLHTLKGMAYGLRFDCASFATGCYYVCRLNDPNGGAYRPGETMYTGSLGEHGERVSEEHAQTGDLVLYGAAPHHHVEVVDDPAKKTTIGHGSAPIDPGVFDLFGDGDYEIRRYI